MKNKQKIEEYFIKNPTSKLRVRQIERVVDVPLPSVVRYVKELIKENIIKITDLGGITLYSANRPSKDFLIKKRLFNINSCYSSGLISFLKEELENPLIILFGSYSFGEDTEESDIDIYLETSKDIKSLEKFEKILKRKIQIFKYKDMKSIKNIQLKNSILNGIVLNGFLEVFK